MREAEEERPILLYTASRAITTNVKIILLNKAVKKKIVHTYACMYVCMYASMLWQYTNVRVAKKQNCVLKELTSTRRRSASLLAGKQLSCYDAGDHKDSTNARVHTWQMDTN